MVNLSNYKIFIRGICLAFISFLIMFYFSSRQTSITYDTATRVGHTQEVLFHTEKLQLCATGIETGSVAFMLTGQDAFLQSFKTSRGEALAEIQTIKEMIADNATQRARLDSIAAVIAVRIAFADSLVSTAPKLHTNGMLAAVNNGRGIAYTAKIKLLTTDMQNAEVGLLQIRKKNNQDSIALQHRLLVYSVLGVVLLLVYYFWKDKGQSLQKEKIKTALLFSSLLEAAPDAMIIVNQKGRIAFVNQHAEMLFNYSRLQLTGLPIAALIHEEINTTGGKLVAEVMAIKNGGTSFPVEVSTAPVETDDGVMLSLSARDITARRKAAAELQQSEASFRSLVTGAKDYAIFMLDAGGKVASWNSGAEKIKGYSKDEILGQSFEVFYPAADVLKGLPTKHIAMVQKYGHIENEGWRFRKDGTSFWADVVMTALKDGAGNIYGYSKITRDITEWKKTQEQLEFLSRQIDQSHDAIFIVDPQRRLKSWNKGAEKLYGYTREEVLGRDANAVLQTDISEATISKALEEMNQQEFWTGELRRITKSGEEIYVRSNTSIVRDDQGLLTAYVSSSFDISGQKKLLQQVTHLASIVEASSEAIFSWGQNNRIISWNHGAEILFGYSREEAICKYPDEPGFIGISPAKRAAIELEVIETGQWKSEMNYHHKDGASFYGSVTANLTKTEKGEISSYNFIVKDISLRKQLEEQLKQSNETLEKKIAERTRELYQNEKRFRALVENNYDIITLIDKDFKIIYCSPSVTRVMGFPKGEMKQLEGIDNVHPDDRAYAKQVIEKAITQPGVPLKAMFRRQHKEGHYVWLEGIITNLLHDEHVQAMVTNFRDVTEYKAAAEKLMASEHRFRSLIENINDAIVLNDAESNILYQSPSVQRILGYTIEERLGRKVLEFIHPGDKEKFIQLYQKLAALPDKPLPFQYRFLSKSGSYLWLEGVVTNLLDNPAVKGYVANYRDITQRKESEEALRNSEEHYRMLVEQSVDGIFLSNAAGMYIDVNQAGCRMMGYEKNEITCMNIAGLILETEIKRLPVELAKFSGNAIASSEWVFLRKDGSSFIGEVIGRMLPDGRLQAIVRDITERKEIEQKIIALNAALEEKVSLRTEELRKSNAELEAFSYSVSHDLRAPLRAIVGFTAKLEDNYSKQLDEEAKRITAIIKNNTLRMGHLIDDLLSFSRMGRQEIVKITIDSNSTVKEIIEAAGSNNSSIEWTVHSLHPVKGDLNTIRQVWVNLISNAIKYSAKEAAPKIEIGSTKGNHEIVFYVRDNGVGFNEKYKTKLFKVFQRLHSADDFEGTGIGLAIVEKVISKHGGSVWAEGAVKEGACFSFSLPD